MANNTKSKSFSNYIRANNKIELESTNDITTKHRDYQQFYVQTDTDTLFTDLVRMIQLLNSVGEVDCKNVTIYQKVKTAMSDDIIIDEAYIYKVISQCRLGYSAKAIGYPLETYTKYFNEEVVQMFILECLSDEQYNDLVKKLNA